MADIDFVVDSWAKVPFVCVTERFVLPHILKGLYFQVNAT